MARARGRRERPRDRRPRFVRLPLSDAERALLREIFVKRPFPRPVKPVKCVKCGQPTLRRLDDSVGICAACER